MTFAFAARAAPRDLRAHPFAAIEIHDDLGAVRDIWRELEVTGGAYQSHAFATAWAQAFGARALIVIARDAAGVPIALLPLHLRRLGPLSVADFLGGAWANYHVGLFRPGVSWREDDVRALLRAAGKQAAVDLFALSNQPGGDNPLALLPGWPSPSNAFASALSGAPDAWLGAHFSRATQKKLRKKVRKLEVFGTVARRRAASGDEAERFVEAFLAHKAAQAQQKGERDLFARPQVRDLLRRLALGETPLMEMHALLAGERVVATFGALGGGRRLSGLIVSYDGALEIAAATPGEWLLIEVARDAIARGFDTLDLGVGDSRYKREICEIEEPLQDSAFAVTPLGQLAAPVYLAGRAALGWLKRRPALLRRVQRLRHAFG